MTTPQQTPQDVIDFWVTAGSTQWFDGGPQFDVQCRDFLTLHLAAAKAQLMDWTENAPGSLGLILLLDQIPRNVFRGSAHAYATDPLARSIARKAMARGYDRQYELELRSFFYLPLMHSESLADQECCVAIFSELPESGSAPWAVHHCDIIRRFGRFPHRNAVLGRETTPEEQAWMDEGGFRG